MACSVFSKVQGPSKKEGSVLGNMVGFVSWIEFRFRGINRPVVQ